MKSLKKIAAVVATLALTVGMTANCFAASWQSYFGVNEAWFEGAEGKLSSQSATGWTADMKTIGWGGCWGAQVKQSVKVKKGEEYTIKYTLSCRDCITVLHTVSKYGALDILSISVKTHIISF